MNKVLFVCRANVCRSPMAEAIFNALAKDAGLEIRAESAGVAALVGSEMDSEARTVLGEIGVYPGEHRACQATRPLVEEVDLVLTMSRRQSAWILDSFGAFADKVHALPAYSDGPSDRQSIVDPHGQSIRVYRTASRVIADYISSIVDRAARGEPSDRGRPHRLVPEPAPRRSDSLEGAQNIR